MKYVVQRLTDGQVKTDAYRYSNEPRWSVTLSDARVYKNKSAAVQSVVGNNSREHYARALIRVIRVKLVAVKE